MRVRSGRLDGVLIFEPRPHRDERGFFVRVLSADVLRSAGVEPGRFVQENQSRSRRGTLRGIHLRAAPSEAKLVRCARGAIFDVVVDLRPWSPTFGEWESFRLDDDRHLQVYVPAGFGHGFQALTEEVDTCYRHDAFYDPGLEAAVAWNDPELAIDWPLPDPLVSARDRAAPSLRAMRPRLAEWFPRPSPGRPAAANR